MTTQPENTAPMRGLSDIEDAAGRALPPVHLWHPETSRDIDMCIHRDGSWSYMGSPIRRDRMVRLFSTILRREDDERYYLVTPKEKCAITVEDVPFVATGLDASGHGREQRLVFTTNVGDAVEADKDHPLRFVADGADAAHIPYVLVRARLEARIDRPIYYDLVDLACVDRHDDADWFGIWSGGQFWPMAPAADIGAE